MAKLFIAVAIRDNSARQALLARLEQLNAKDALARRLQCDCLTIETYAGTKLHEDLQAAERALIDFYVTGASSWAILISDSLVDERKPAEVVLHLADQFLGKAFGTIGVHPRGARVPEIDRILKPNASPDQVSEILELVAARLRYVTPPIRSQRKVEFQIRRIRDEYELKQCYLL